MSDNINVEVKKKNPSIPPKNLRQLTKQVAEIEGTIDDINESVEEAEQDVHEIKRAIDNSDDFVIRDNKMKRKNKAYNPAQYSGLGEIYLEKNNIFLGREFDEFVVNVDVPDPTAIAETFDGLVYDRHRKEFLVYELVDGERVYYAEWIKFDKWESTDDYIPEASYDFICEADNKAYRWTEETTPDLIETEAHYGNVLKQEMVNFSNTIYHIQYDYTLIGKEITIPEGCLLKFEGGAISNGTLVGQNTILVYNQPLNDILTATLEGTWRHESGVKADEEDITDINGELKFKDKAYIPANYSGLGKKYLRKNFVNGVNTLTQEMMPDANTIYVIQYDYTLGEDIIVPTDCVLEFDGGSIRGGAITMNGKMPTFTIYTPEMFGAVGDGITDDTQAIQNMLNICKNCRMDSNYAVSNYSMTYGNTIPVACKIPSNTDLEINGTIKYNTGNTSTYDIFALEYHTSNVNIHGHGSIIGDLDETAVITGEQGHGIHLYAASHITIDGINISKCFGDGIVIAIDWYPHESSNLFLSYYVNILNCTIHDCRRNGITQGGGCNVVIDNCYIYNIVGIEPKACIDVEREIQATLDNTRISNCRLINPGEYCNGIDANKTVDGYSITNLTIENCYVDAGNVIVADNVNISNCYFTSLQFYSGILNDCTIKSLYLGCVDNADSIINVNNCNINALNSPSINNADVNVIFNGCNIIQDSSLNSIIDLKSNHVICSFYNCIIEKTANTTKDEFDYPKVNIIKNCNIKWYGSFFMPLIAEDCHFIFANAERKDNELFKIYAGPEKYLMKNCIIECDWVGYLFGNTYIAILLNTIYMITETRYNTIFRNNVYDINGKYYTSVSDMQSEEHNLPSESGTFANKPTTANNSIKVGFKYFCTDKQTIEGATDGIEIIHKGNDVWVDALGRTVS